MKNTVGVNEFVRRQIKGSGKTYAIDLTFKDIALHAQQQLAHNRCRDGYRDGVIIVEVDKLIVNKFICPLVELDIDTKLSAQLVKRRSNEDPYIQIRAVNGKKLRTEKVEIILYRGDVLRETHEQCTETDWELIAFQAIPKGFKTLPMGPITMMRNQLCLKGGTKGHYSSEQWARSVQFWQKYALLK